MPSPTDAGTQEPPPPEPVDAGEPAQPGLPPIQAPAGQWTWVPLDEVLCGDGSTSGIGVNLMPSSSHLVIFLQGGGACWDDFTCGLGTAFNLDGYGASKFAMEQDLTDATVLQRNLADNPFRDASYVYVPYCTGDVLTGDKVATYDVLGTSRTIRHVGYRNLSEILRHVAATFPAVDRVWLIGESSGGFAAAWNFDHVQRALPFARVDVIDDSGPPLDFPAERFQAWVSAWNMQVPAGCSDCLTRPQGLLDYNTLTYPTHRFALLSYADDLTISAFAGISTDDFHSRLVALTQRFDGSATARYFVEAGTDHVMLGQPIQTVSGVSVPDWLTKMVDDSVPWASVR
jgi:hypothetical protein